MKHGFFNSLQTSRSIRIILLCSERMLDGFCLRQRYYGPIALEECSVLEMMVALAKRIDDDILYDYEIGTQTEKWFWMMIDSLGLSGMTDDSFDENTVTRIIYNFMGIRVTSERWRFGIR